MPAGLWAANRERIIELEQPLFLCQSSDDAVRQAAARACSKSSHVVVGSISHRLDICMAACRLAVLPHRTRTTAAGAPFVVATKYTRT